MAIRVLVKGDRNGDYELFANEGLKNRINDTAILEMLDQYKNLLYIVPLSNILLIETIHNDLVHTKIDSNIKYNTLIYVGSDSTREDFSVECNKITYDWFINETMINANIYQDLDEKTKEFKLLITHSIPIQNIRFIDYKNPIVNNFMEDSDSDFYNNEFYNEEKYAQNNANINSKYVESTQESKKEKLPVRVKRPVRQKS